MRREADSGDDVLTAFPASVRRKFEGVLAEVREGNLTPERTKEVESIRQTLSGGWDNVGFLLWMPGYVLGSALTESLGGCPQFVAGLAGAYITSRAAPWIDAEIRRRRPITIKLLRLIEARVTLSPVEQIGAEAGFQSLEEPTRLWWREELLPTLSALAEEDDRLEAISIAPTDPAPIKAERLRLKIDLAKCEDEEACRAIHRSLEIVDRRLALVRASEVSKQRIAAHRELLRQSAMATVEAARSATEAARMPGFASLRADADALTAEGRALEAAVLELRTMD